MKLLDHVSLTVRHLEQVRAFYMAVMSVLGAKVIYDVPTAMGFGERNSVDDYAHTYLSILQSAEAYPDSRRHWCFRAISVQQVKDFYSAGIATGGECAGAPGIRTYHPGYYSAFLLDPEGNKIESVFHEGELSR